MIIKPIKGSSPLLILSFEGSKEFGHGFPILKGLPDRRKKWLDRDLAFLPEPGSILYINRHFPDAKWIEGAEIHLSVVEEKERERERLRAEKHSGIFDDDGEYEYARPPRPHQRSSFIRARDLVAYGHFHQQGCGKSKILIDTAAHSFKQGRIDRLLIIAPNGVHRQWISKLLPEDVPPWLPYKAHFVSPKDTKRENAAIQEVMDFEDGLRILSFHVEGFVSKRQKARLRKFLDGGPTLMAIDESSDIKNADAKRTKYLDAMGKHAVMRRIMDGTPVTEGVEELFSQFRFLDPNIIGHTQIETFVGHYCIKGGWQGSQIVGYKNLEELLELIDPYCDRVLKADVIDDLPDKTYHQMPFAYSPKQREIINTLRDKLAAEWKGKKLDPQLAITRLLRIQQVASGWWPDEDERKLYAIDKKNPRMTALDSIIKHAHDKVIVWSRFVPDLLALQERYGSNATSYHGQISKDQQELNINHWREPTGPDILLANPAAGIARGYTLIESATTVYYANHMSLRKRLQSEDRNHRDGQKRAVNVWDLMGTGAWSIDARIIRGFLRKKEISDLVANDPAGFLTWLPEDD